MPGSVAPIARELSTSYGVLEPFQTSKTLGGQVEELKDVLEKHGTLPVFLIGWSHGSGLSCLLASRHPNIVKKLIVIGTTPFGEKYQAEIARNRLLRLCDEERAEFLSLAGSLQNSADEDRNAAMLRLVQLAGKTESYESFQHKDEVLEIQPEIMISIGNEWRRLLDSGELMNIIPAIKCPVVAIQGDYDVNPAEGVKEQFSNGIKDFRFILLEKCGHSPWYEKHARDEFFRVIKEEIAK